jgi:drug/metabolite transporter (DMT)-like permease
MNRKLGALYGVATAVLLATQPPLSSPAAKAMSPIKFVFLTQVGLLVSVPLLLSTGDSRRDCLALLRSVSHYGRLGVILAAGAAALVLYNLSLAGAHPVIVTAVLNLAPFWAALVALALTGTPIPGSPIVFFGCFLCAFAGATAIAWSQASDAQWGGLIAALAKGAWLFAIPIPLLTTLSVSLVAKWFSDRDPSGAVAANFVVSAGVLIPATLALLLWRGEPILGDALAAALMIAGVILADSVGRVFYQKALKITGDDNGFVTMFQTLEPALGAGIAYGLSFWFRDLAVKGNWIFVLGLVLTGASLLVFSFKALATERASKDRRPQVGNQAFPTG